MFVTFWLDIIVGVFLRYHGLKAIILKKGKVEYENRHSCQLQLKGKPCIGPEVDPLKKIAPLIA